MTPTSVREAHIEVDDHEQEVSLEHLLSIWPIASSIVSYTAAGDLISLSRTSSEFRAITHGYPIHRRAQGQVRNPVDLQIGDHQTPQWARLKAVSSFSCSLPEHKEPKSSSSSTQRPTQIRACKFCSRPVCKACIVRSFFADPSASKNTFRYRSRYLCTDCWESGNLRKDFRYPLRDGTPTREHVWAGRAYAQRGGTCSCQPSEDNWLCGDCRSLQNAGGPTNISPSDAAHLSPPPAVTSGKSSQPEAGITIQCYGLSCTNKLSRSTDPYLERRRICLWCSRALPRQYLSGPDGHYAYAAKLDSIRAAAAAARSADIAEYHRTRFRSLTMSRREFRGTDMCLALYGNDAHKDVNGHYYHDHDQPIFVRHLDAMNYRGFMKESACPTPQQVYESKHGRWTYSARFLQRVSDKCTSPRLVPRGYTGERLFGVTSAGAPRAARTNAAMAHAHPFHDARDEIVRRAAHYVEAGIMHDDDMDGFKRLYEPKIRWEAVRDAMSAQLEHWDDVHEDGRNGWKPVTLKELLAQPANRAGKRPQSLQSQDALKIPSWEDLQQAKPGDDETGSHGAPAGAATNGDGDKAPAPALESTTDATSFLHDAWATAQTESDDADEADTTNES